MKNPLRLKLVIVVSLTLTLLRLQTGAQTQTGQAAPARTDAHVIIISVDGLVPEYYTSPAQIGLKVPTLTRMKLDGAYADGVEGVYPSVTYPAHTTLVTGVRPALHGIVQNRIFEAPTQEPSRDWYFFSKDLKVDTLWTISKKAGLVTGAVGWPVTVGAEIDYNMPEIFDPKESPPTPRRAVPYITPGLLAKAAPVLAAAGNSTDARRTAMSEFIITTYKPNLMLIHLVELDNAHHAYGTRSPQALAVAEREDQYINRIVEATRKAGIFDKTTFFIVSDHGFAAVEKKFNPNVVLAKEGLITVDASGKVTDWKAAAWPAGGSCAIVLSDPSDRATAAKATAAFEKYLAQSRGPISRIVARKDLDRLGAIPEALLMLEAGPGITFDEYVTGPEIVESKDYRGTHGHLPSRVELRSALIVYGAGAKAGAKLSLARMIDIAPTAAGLLGLYFTDAEGRAISELVKPGLLPKVPAKKKAK
jgi:predicted AlkP superfamily pyrophosphatase or phosphodiesterase